MTRVLQGADDRLSFHKFLKLPPELRNIVYEFYVAAFPSKLELCSQPPLARTSSLVPKEMLPAFYGRKAFEMILETHDGNEFQRASLRFAKDTTRFLCSAAPETISSLRTVELRITGTTKRLRGACLVGMNKKASEHMIEVDGCMLLCAERVWLARRASDNEEETGHEFIKQNVSTQLDQVCGRTRRGLVVSDLSAIRVLLEEVSR